MAMSKRMKVLVAVVVAILVLAVGGTAVVMAQEEELPPTPETETNGLLARVADNLGISQEELANAFKEARQEMRQEAFLKFLDKAVEEGRITPEEADEIREWWEQRPEAANGMLLRARICQATRSRQMQQQGILPMHGGPATPPWLAD